MFKILLILFTLFSIGSGFQEISPDTLSLWLKGNAPPDFILIDLRENNEINTIIGSENCGAYNFPYRSKVFDKIVETLPKDTMIILYCASGNRSKQAVEELDMEFSNIFSLAGGMNSWRGPTLPGNKIKSSDLFPEVICTPVAVLSPKKVKSSPIKNSLADKRINLLGKMCSAVSPGMLITINKRIILLKPKNK
ncbi:MAG: rhodanese-like domain-containing protein [Fibrobacter sp.]|jgi:rhodanese-related sulfurtransferase|nr:rhodanese-like domain-containing protein [Fibrobacter sp.]